MRLESVLFKSSHADRYERMANVLRASAAEHSPATPLNITRVYDPDDDVKAIARLNCKTTYIDNVRKAKHHCKIVREATYGELIGFLDVDAMVLGDLSEVMGMDFDIAYTKRPEHHKWKLNTGVYFVRIRESTQKFVSRWFATAMGMLNDYEFHEQWKRHNKYGGTQQAAFGWMIENFDLGLKLLPLDCESWNVVPPCIDDSHDVKVVHIMSSMREWCFGRSRAKGEKQIALVETWREYDRQCNG